MDEQESLAWDYTADEESQLLEGGVRPKNKRRPNVPAQGIHLSRQHAALLCQYLENSASVLQHSLLNDRLQEWTSQEVTPSKFRGVLDKLAANVLLMTIVLHATILVIASVTQAAVAPDSEMSISLTIVISLIGFLNILLLSYTFHSNWTKFRIQNYVSLSSIVQAYLSIIFVSATVYCLSYQLQVTGWVYSGVPMSQIAEVYAIMFYTALGHTLPIGTSSGMSPSSWINSLLLSTQSLLSFAVLLILIYTMLHPAIHPSPSPSSSLPRISTNQKSFNKSFHQSGSSPHSLKAGTSTTTVEDSSNFDRDSTDTAFTSDTAFIDQIHNRSLFDSKIPSYQQSRDSLLQSMESGYKTSVFICDKEKEQSFLRTAYGSI